MLQQQESDGWTEEFTNLDIVRQKLSKVLEAAFMSRLTPPQNRYQRRCQKLKTFKEANDAIILQAETGITRPRFLCSVSGSSWLPREDNCSTTRGSFLVSKFDSKGYTRYIPNSLIAGSQR